MNRNKRCDQNRKSQKPQNTHVQRRRRDSREDVKDKDKLIDSKLNAEARPNDPNYYFLDRRVAEQVSQLSFQQLGGVPFNVDGQTVTYPNVMVRYWNPSAGDSGLYSASGSVQQSGINMAGLRIFTKLSAYTGRQAIYGPQDISTMILALGEVISTIEWCRRVFGVAFLGSETNRTYPSTLLTDMNVDPGDFYTRYAEYRNRFNKIITLANQIPIPQNVAYFDKCAHMYEKLYLDAPSPLATVIVDTINTSWVLDETAYSGGSILATVDWTWDHSTQAKMSLQKLHYYLSMCEFLVNRLLTSSTLQVVYTDLLNLASKQNVQFWKFDYLVEGYLVVPEYNQKYLLMAHNATVCGMPTLPTFNAPQTPYNDVYPDPSNNGLIYSPAFAILKPNTLISNAPNWAIVDMLDPNPTVEDRIEVLRWIAMSDGWGATIGGVEYSTKWVLADHYVTHQEYWSGTTHIHNGTSWIGDSFASIIPPYSEKVDWHSLYYGIDDATFLWNGKVYGDLNYYTQIDSTYLRPIFDFTALALYDMR